MAKPAKQVESKDSKNKAKQLRTAANREKRVAKHAKVVESKAKHPAKTPRGMARALSRWQTGKTRGDQPSSLMPQQQWQRIKQQPRKQEAETIRLLPTVTLNGVVMTTEQAAVEARRLLADRRKQEQRETVLA